jgi:N-acetylglucosaminylphosphatidylinositol deacetylase
MSILIVTAHPDDESMFFSPTIQNLIRCRKRVHILCLSSGSSPFLSFLFLCLQDHDCLFLCNPLGDSLNQGKIRKLELYHSCSILGVPRSNVMLIEDVRLRDGLHSVWPADVIAEYVGRAIDSVCPDKVCFFLMSLLIRTERYQLFLQLITFDCLGVSGHINHIHTCRGTCFAARRKCPSDAILSLVRASILDCSEVKW